MFKLLLQITPFPYYQICQSSISSCYSLPEINRWACLKTWNPECTVRACKVVAYYPLCNIRAGLGFGGAGRGVVKVRLNRKKFS